jgi:hypothetical protein
MDCFASLAMTAQKTRPTGKSPKTCLAPLQKIFRFRRRANQRYQRPFPARGLSEK